jgi:hypothetical protein
VLDRRTCANIAVAAAPIAVIISSVVITGRAVGVPTVVSIIVFVGRPGAQETPYCRVVLSRLVVFLLFQGGVVPIPRLVVILVFQFPVEKELEILAIGQGLIVL